MEETKKKAKIIAYIGQEKCNLLHCLVTAGVKAGFITLVVDNSTSHDFFNLYDKNDGESVVEVDKLTVCKDTTIEYEDMDGYDYVYIYSGMNTPNAVFAIPNIFIVTTTFEKNDINRVHEIVEALHCEENPICILRDKAGKKLSDSTMIAKLGVIPSYLRTTELNYDEYASYIALTHNGHTKMYGGEISSIASELLEKIYDLSTKQIKKILK